MHEAERSELESPVQIPHFQEPPFRDADACGGQADDAEHPRPVQHAQRPVPDVEIAEIGLGHGEAAHVPHGVHGHDAQQAPRRAGPVDGHGHGFKAGGGMLFKGLVHALLFQGADFAQFFQRLQVAAGYHERGGVRLVCGFQNSRAVRPFPGGSLPGVFPLGVREGYAAFTRGMEQGQVSRVPAAVGGGAHGQSQDFFRSVHRTGRNGILHRQGEVVIDKSRFHGSCLVRMASPSSSNKWTAQDWHGS